MKKPYTRATDDCKQAALESNEINITGSYLRDLCVDRGLSVRQIADELGCRVNFIYDVFNGKKQKSEFIPKLLFILNNSQVKTGFLRDKIRRTRLKKNLNTKEMSGLMGCSESLYKNMENGCSSIDNVYAVKMSEILGFEIQPDIITLTDKNRNDVLMSRKVKWLSQKELGEKVGYNQTSIGKIENGVNDTMPYDIAVKLEQILGIKLLT